MKQRHALLLPQTSPDEHSPVDSLPVSGSRSCPAALHSRAAADRSPLPTILINAMFRSCFLIAELIWQTQLAWLLQEEILARILGLLQPCQLHWVERVNTRLRNTGKDWGRGEGGGTMAVAALLTVPQGVPKI